MVPVVAAAVVVSSVAVASPAAAAPEAPAPVAQEDLGPGVTPPPSTPYPAQDDAVAESAANAEPGPDSTEPVELSELRTQTSTTVEDPVTGLLTTQLSTESVNFQDESGAWVPIDSTLVENGTGADAGFITTANRFDAEFPADLTTGDPLTLTDVADPDLTVSLALQPIESEPSSPVEEPAPPAEVDGAEVTYPDAVADGVNVAYEAQPDSIKESIVLDSPAAVAGLGETGSVSFDLGVGPGLTPVLDGEVIDVVDGSGQTVFLIPAPFMDDAAGAHSEDVTVALAQSESGWTLTLTPDGEWLADPARVFPVVVDPTITYPSPTVACAIRSANPTASECAGTLLPLSRNSTDGTQERSLIRFSGLLDVIPADALVTRAALNLHVTNVAGWVPTSVDVREVTAAWTTSATWNRRQGTTTWATAGGDRATGVTARATLTPNGTYQTLEVGELVSRWVEGSTAHNGLIVEKTAAAAGGQPLLIGAPAGANAPTLTLTWQNRTGVRKGNTAAVSITPTDRTEISVNPATGNAAVSTNEFTIAGVGLDLQVGHTSNSLDTSGLSPLGYGWTTTTGGFAGARLDVQPWGAQYTDGTGARFFFHRAIDGTYTRPMGLDADLTTGANNTFVVTERQSKVAQTFTGIGGTTYGLSTIADRNGNTITYTYDTSATLSYSGTRVLRSITDTRGRVHTIANSGSWNTSATDSANRSVLYAVTGNRLTTYTDASGGQVRYSYDAANRVTSVLSPENHRVNLAYDTTGRITTLTRVSNPTNGTGPTWTFGYTTFDRSGGAPATTTTVTDPNGNTTTYVSDGRGLVSKVTDARGKNRSATYSPNDDALTSIGATPAAGGGAATSTSTFNAGSFTLASTRVPTGAGMALTYGTGARTYDVLTSTDARGNATTYTYNTYGETSTVTRGGTTTRYLYQGDTDPTYGGTVNCGPTVNNAVTATKRGVLCEERDALYANGTTAAATSAHRTAYRYDAAGQLVTMIPAGTLANGTSTTGLGIATYTYDGLSRLQTLTDGKGQQTYYGYDTQDRLGYVLHHDDSVESSYFTADGPLRSLAEYNAAGTQTRFTDYKRQPELVDRYDYISYPNENVHFSYDALGLLTGYRDNGGQVTYGYNPANQLISIAEPGGSCAGQTYTTPGAASTRCILFRVDDDGRRTGILYPGGSTQTWTLDDAGRTTQTVGTSAGVTRVSLGYTYTDPNAPATTDNPNRDTGMITRIADGATGRSTSYSYDALDRLTAANTTPTTGGATVDFEGFCYDAMGNRTRYYTAVGANCGTANPAQQLTYNAANQLTAAAGTGFTGNGFAYDGNGNQTSAVSTPGRITSYNDRDQAVSTTPTGGSAIPSTYAGSGNRDRTSAGGTTVQSSPLAPAPASSAVAGVSTWTVRDPSGTLVAIRQGATSTPAQATSYYVFLDQVGAVRAMIGNSGAVAAAYTYSAFGITRTATGPIATSNPYRYGQGFTDSATGLIKLGARFYDPAVGRFTQADPSGQEANTYLYSAGDPITRADPGGLISEASVWKSAFSVAFSAIGLVIGPGLIAQLAFGAISTIVQTGLDCLFGCDGGVLRTAAKNAALAILSYSTFGLIARQLGIVGREGASLSASAAGGLADLVITNVS